MIAALNRLVDLVESSLTTEGTETAQAAADDIDVAAVARAEGTTEYHLRRMFSSLAVIPLAE